MSISINTNTTAINAAYNLNQSNAKLQQAMAELSSGSKIVNPSDDAGGLAVSLQMNATIAQASAQNTNIADAQSYLQTQDGSINVASSILNRVQELSTMAADPTKSTSEVAAYNTEFTQLKTQLSNVSSGKFNGIAMFNGAALSVGTSPDGGTESVTSAGLTADTSTIAAATSLGALAQTDLTAAITAVATEAATNGAQSSGLNFASQTLSAETTNMQAAVGRITDVDVASESTALAQDNVLVQAGAAMLSQANSSSQIALKLLQ
jgi:flagellin